MLFPKTLASRGKIEIFFAAFYFYLYELNKCLIFFKSYFRMETLLFLSFVMSFLEHLFNEKSAFVTKKKTLSEINVEKY